MTDLPKLKECVKPSAEVDQILRVHDARLEVKGLSLQRWQFGFQWEAGLLDISFGSNLFDTQMIDLPKLQEYVKPLAEVDKILRVHDASI